MFDKKRRSGMCKTFGVGFLLLAMGFLLNCVTGIPNFMPEGFQEKGVESPGKEETFADKKEVVADEKDVFVDKGEKVITEEEAIELRLEPVRDASSPIDSKISEPSGPEPSVKPEVSAGPKIQIVSVTATGYYAAHRHPSRAVDNSLSSGYWSDSGPATFILELSQKARVSYVRIAFPLIHKRTFDLYVSEDKKTWHQVFKDKKTSGLNNVYERFNFPTPRMAKYVRFDGKGSPNSRYNSIAEFDVNGFEKKNVKASCIVDKVALCKGKCGLLSNRCGSSGKTQCGACSSPFKNTSSFLLYVDFEQNKIPSGTYTNYTETMLKKDWVTGWKPSGTKPTVMMHNGLRAYGKYHNGTPKTNRVKLIKDSESYNGGKSVRILFPKKMSGTTGTGAEWQIKFPKGHKELYLAYRIKFGTSKRGSFEFVDGGKIPGFIGGNNGRGHFGIGGGTRPTGYNGWSARGMWRKEARLMQYLYYVDTSCKSKCNTSGAKYYGDSGPYRYSPTQDVKVVPGKWGLIEHRVRINTPETSYRAGNGKKDGIMEAWWNGKKVLSMRNIRWVHDKRIMIEGLYFALFYGGSGPSYSPPRDEYIFIDDFIISTKPITH